MFIRRLTIIIAALSACLSSQKSFAQYDGFDKDNPYTQLIPQPRMAMMYGSKDEKSPFGDFILDKKTIIVCNNEFIGQYLAERICNLTGSKPPVFKKDKLPEKYSKRKHTAISIFTAQELGMGSHDDGMEESYSIKIDKNAVFVVAGGQAGMFNSVQTILQLLPAKVYDFNNKVFEKQAVIPAGSIKDQPEFSYRGFELDVSRTWRPAEVVYKVLDWMAYHKLNKFHWHLTDDQGWRVEIKSLPLLTEKGAWRGPAEVIPSSFGSGNKRYGGFYTQQQIKDIVKYAADRNIEIIPEIETPGHSAAIAGSYPEILCNAPEDTSVNNTGFSREIWCVAKEHNYEIIDKIIKEMAQMFPSKIINMGGDEVNQHNWTRCPDCQALMKEKGMKDTHQLHEYFVRRVNDIAKKYGKKIAGWEEIMMADGIQDNALIYVWHRKKFGPQAVQNGFDCVMQAAEYVYLDMQQSPIERGHNWARVIPLDITYSYDPIALAAAGKDAGKAASNLELAKKHVVGVQAGLWEELGNRPDNFVEYQMFPRLCALAETGWGTSRTIADSAANYQYFYDRLTQAHFARMENMGIRFRVPYPEVKAEPVAFTKLDVLRSESYMRPYKITVTPPYEGAVVKYAIVSPQTEIGNIRGQKDTTNYKYVYTEPIITRDIANYRFATFVSDTLHSVGVAVSNMPLQTVRMVPHFEIETNMKASEKNLSILKEYKKNSYCRFEGRAKKGDYITFIFEEPVKCSVIDIVTGRSNVDFYGLTEGYAEYSEDGVNYKGKKEVDCSRIVLTPDTMVKSVRITVTGESDGQNFFLPPLKIY